MVEVTRREKTEEEKKVIEEVRKSGAQWMGEDKMDEILKHDIWWDAEQCLEYGLIDEIV